jgi:hypothetical protein
LCAGLALACDQVTGPPLAICRGGVQPLALAVGAYATIDPQPTGGCVVFPANASADSAEYVLVPLATTETPDLTGTFRLLGGGPLQAAASVLTAVAPPTAGERFDHLLRELERTRAYAQIVGPTAEHRALPRVPARVTVGDQRVFKVLSSLTGNRVTYVNVTGVAQSVGQHIAIYVDAAAPAGGLTPQDVDALRSVFDTALYAADTTAFGRESDIDGNGMVLVLMTNVVNTLVSAAQCQQSGYVAGFFFALDIDPSSAYEVNDGEIFYTIVADSGATLSCSHPQSQVKRILPVTLVHEFQHMISYNQHALIGGGPGEVLWLNEAMSHYAEERGGRAFLPSDTATFCDLVRNDLSNVAQYLSAPGSHPLVDTAGIGGLAERGAGWLFVRYLADRFAQDTTLAGADAFTRQLEQTTLTGTANVAQQTGRSFAATARDWALANWVSDLPGFTAPDSLRYTHWAFRAAYPRLNARCTPPGAQATFPLVAAAAPGAGVLLTGGLASGSAGGYARALQGPGDPQFTLLFSDSGGAQLHQTVQPRLAVLRIR